MADKKREKDSANLAGCWMTDRWTALDTDINCNFFWQLQSLWLATFGNEMGRGKGLLCVW